MKETDIPISHLQDLLVYEPETGVLRWRHHRRCRAAPVDGAIAGHLHKASGYWVVRVMGQQLRAHRVAWAIARGAWPNGLIDHRDRDPTNNRIDNLRLVSPRGNSFNRDPLTHSTTGVVGVGFTGGSQFPWRAYIVADGKRRYLGGYSTPLDAVAARIAAERRFCPTAPPKDALELASLALTSVMAYLHDRGLDLPLFGKPGMRNRAHRGEWQRVHNPNANNSCLG